MAAQRRHASRNVFVLLAASALLAPAALARDDDADALAGPRIKAQVETSPSLVTRDFQGKLQVLGERPEVAAVRLLQLDDATRAKVDQIITQRAALVSQITLEHYDLFAKFQAAFASGEVTPQTRRDRAAVVAELREVAKPLFKPAFVDTLAQELSAAQAEHLRAMVEEYRDAVIASEDAARSPREAKSNESVPPADTDSMTGMQEQTKPVRPRRARWGGGNINVSIRQQAYDLRQVGREMGRSFQTFIADKQERAEDLYARVEATPEQRAKIDAILRKDGEAAALMPTDAQRRERFERILALLTPEQRRKMLQDVRPR
jgi:hypothetical protein